jgi:hypothetical protein
LPAWIRGLREHPNHPVFRDGARGPALVGMSREPTVNRIVADMIAIDQRDQRIHVE